MASATIGSLRVELSMGSAAFTRGAKEAQQSLGQFNTNITAAARNAVIQSATIIGSFVKVASEIKRLMRDTFEDIKALDQIGQSSGIGIQALSGLKGAVELAGGSFNSLKGAIENWQQAIADVNRGELSAMSQALLNLNLSLTDSRGGFVAFDDLLSQVADKVSGMSSTVSQAKAVTDIFGKSAADLVPLFQKGGAGVDELKQKARELGLVLDDTAAVKAKEYTEAIKTLKGAWDGFGMSLAIIAAGPVKAANDAFLEFLKNEGEVRRNLALSAATKAWDDQKAAVKGVQDEIARLTSDRDAYVNDRGWSPASAAIRAMDAEIKKLTDSISGLQAKADAAKDVVKGMRFGTMTVTENETQSPDTAEADAQAKVIQAINTQLDELQRQLEGMPVLFTNAFALDPNPFLSAMATMDVALDQQARKYEEIARLKEKLQKSEQAMILNTATLAANAISSLWPRNKKAAIAAAVINGSVAVTRALSDAPPPLNFINAALVAAAAVGQVNQIKSTSLEGGGSVAAPSGGGSGGGDSGGGAAAAAPAPRTLYIEQMGMGGMFSPQAVRELIERINIESRDGAVLIVNR